MIKLMNPASIKHEEWNNVMEFPANTGIQQGRRVVGGHSEGRAANGGAEEGEASSKTSCRVPPKPSRRAPLERNPTLFGGRIEEPLARPDGWIFARPGRLYCLHVERCASSVCTCDMGRAA
ncbi:unnamed protein product [Brugia pahangi]|uniref:Uncharacterized protein n=1 Tax=Brugia pahangi TaxID=6280 RepID=A0A0N4SY01_BRUPA|nr:unnamed protein product [Brugia pahangi]